MLASSSPQESYRKPKTCKSDVPEHLKIIKDMAFESPKFTLFSNAKFDQLVGEKEMCVEMRRKLVRCTMDRKISDCNILTILRRSNRPELMEMAKSLVEINPALQDKYVSGSKANYVSFLI